MIKFLLFLKSIGSIIDVREKREVSKNRKEN